MRAHYLQHVPFEGLGSIETWLHTAGYDISSTKLYAAESLPALDGIEMLIIMGGPMSVNDEEQYPWLGNEKTFIQQAIDSGIPVLGICLGAQLIASAMGAKIFANPVKEIGWFPITSVPAPII
ncbi:type 1 glutamine amidotransferase [Oceanicoccus sp. KOV_DT_Chl]|uniref:type 1 glutamine amidotransferase n=1 Tax=Oceanicoccus sp. KOV_DT_Chl TaxID=1904639 RepID=UPI00190EAF92|nr:type 1 glutamine amidotransferase [Oceanicoccus sp. KOV_DT_Chl]